MSCDSSCLFLRDMSRTYLQSPGEDGLVPRLLESFRDLPEAHAEQAHNMNE